MNALIGKKVGMTQVFDEAGNQIPVTVIQAGPCVVVQRKTAETDGYDAVQIGYGEQKPQRVNKPSTGHFAKAGVPPQRRLKEFRVDAASELKAGDSIGVNCFNDINYVDVTATSKGRGFQGVVKRWNFGGGRATHGSHHHRTPGSIGMCTFPSRVFKGKKMPGHMGNTQITVQNLKVIAVREEDHAILVKGAIPGPTGGYVQIRKAIKKA
jgi:large subunit ribosomal protein L3